MKLIVRPVYRRHYYMYKIEIVEGEEFRLRDYLSVPIVLELTKVNNVWRLQVRYDWSTVVYEYLDKEFTRDERDRIIQALRNTEKEIAKIKPESEEEYTFKI